MKSRTFAAVLILVAGLALPAFAQASDTYRIATKLRSNGELVGEPTMTVHSGEPATIGVPGADGYTLTAIADPVEGAAMDQARVRMELTMGNTPQAEPEVIIIVVRMNEPATLAFQTTHGEVAVEVTVSK